MTGGKSVITLQKDGNSSGSTEGKLKLNELQLLVKTINDIKIIMQRYIRTLINSRVNSETFLSLIHNN